MNEMPPPDPTRNQSTADRRTPYELVFTEGDFESNIFPRIQSEALERGVDPGEPERFEFLSIAGDVIRELTPEEADPAALDLYRLLLFHAFNFWRGGRRLFVLDPGVSRYLVEAAMPLDEWKFEMPSDSAYLQLPANLFWSSITPDTAPEPIDGFFLTLSRRPDHRQNLVSHLEVLVVLGIHRSRAGFSVMPLSTQVGAGMDTMWTAPPRTGGDFQNVLPGGEIAGLYSILTTAEVLKLVGRAFAYIERYPELIVEVEGGDTRTDGDPPPTLLPHSRITLGEPDPDSTAGRE